MLRQPILKPLCLVNKLRNPENVRILCCGGTSYTSLVFTTLVLCDSVGGTFSIILCSSAHDEYLAHILAGVVAMAKFMFVSLLPALSAFSEVAETAFTCAMPRFSAELALHIRPRHFVLVESYSSRSGTPCWKVIYLLASLVPS